MIRRTDVHRPAAIVPADYDFIGFEYIGRSEELQDALNDDWRDIEKHITCTGGKFAEHRHGGTCDVCGAGATYLGIFYHRPSNEYIRTGSDCASKMHLGDPRAFAAFRERVLEHKQFVAGRAKALAALTTAGIAAAFDIYMASDRTDEYEERTIRDIISKLVRYGSISDKQVEFLRKLLGQIATREERARQRAAEEAAALPIPAELVGNRSTITGLVLATRKVETNFGIVTKMLLKTDAGWKCWGSNTYGLVRGDRVQLDARLERSRDNDKFGFFSRPTRVVVLESLNEGDRLS